MSACIEGVFAKQLAYEAVLYNVQDSESLDHGNLTVAQHDDGVDAKAFNVEAQFAHSVDYDERRGRALVSRLDFLVLLEERRCRSAFGAYTASVVFEELILKRPCYMVINWIKNHGGKDSHGLISEPRRGEA